MIGRDLGTYHFRITFNTGEEIIYKHETSGRFVGGGTEHISPSNAQWVHPIYQSEKELIESAVYLWTEGNYGCDCNIGAFIAYAKQAHDPDLPCGQIYWAKEIEVIGPDGLTVNVLHRSNEDEDF